MASTLCSNSILLSSSRRGRHTPHSIAAPARLILHRSVSHGARIERVARIAKIARIVPAVAKLVRFKGRKEVSIPFQERLLSPGEYLKETARIVKVTFPDSARIKYLGDSVWQARLMTIAFFKYTATPSADVRVEHDDGVLLIDSSQLLLDVTGLPEQFRNMDMQLNLHGELRVLPRRVLEDQEDQEEEALWDFGGFVDVGVAVNVPVPLSLIPERVLTRVGDQVVERILSSMEGSLLQGIIEDYNVWCAGAVTPVVSSAQRL